VQMGVYSQSDVLYGRGYWRMKPLVVLVRHYNVNNISYL
jgi:hypothetical protein